MKTNPTSKAPCARRSVPQAGKRRIPHVAALWIALGLIVPFSVGADKLLIVNSDVSVRKYLVAQTAFKETVGGDVSLVDLGGKNTDRNSLSETITSQQPDAVYCIGSKAYLTTYSLTKDARIVVSSAINWERFPIGPRTHGVANELPSGMQLTMFRYVFPEIKTIGLIYSKKFQKEWVSQAKADAQDVSIDLKAVTIGPLRPLSRALRKLLPTVDALWLISDPAVLSGPEAIADIFEQSNALKKPIFACHPAFAERGAVMAISPDVPTIGRQAAALAMELLADEEVDAQFQTPAGSEITINLKAVNAYGMKLNPGALDSVNRMIK
ncbi:MAG: hypothetical protein HN742_08675 [Lentisphaerae bacterium]|jgi:putative tryptophan/tyrosine transport system substrate-binding protein|nr:hypothetical protein [Lentisphaerota bacterium]MBT4818953.1 hypothetical protein [Lentisphaerota bacterium]MBT5610317.1 hypothetical protein [Lentisphaerota bacterium]MBT7056145.1 hypothetical protein [Lentisphaerota bacterium]MBT7841933.1 hypothetical protein [Lentisphaerota bacterium]